MKRIVSVLFSVIIIFCFGGCKKDKKEVIVEDNFSGTAADFFTDVDTVRNFTCYVEYNGEQKKYSGEPAKEIYSIVRKSMKNAEETGESEKGSNPVKIIFQSGEQKEENNTSQNNIKYYGVVDVYDNDTVDFSGSPDATVSLCYKIAKGTYSSIIEKVEATSEVDDVQPE